jgi:hypothetical protein
LILVLRCIDIPEEKPRGLNRSPIPLMTGRYKGVPQRKTSGSSPHGYFEDNFQGMIPSVSRAFVV